jgi:regulator of nucleoside diphosphate kinase
METHPIFITPADHQRLRDLIEIQRNASRRLPDSIKALEAELNRAIVTDSAEKQNDVITLNSKAKLRDEETGEIMEWQLVLPSQANVEEGKISILAPLGTAMLGYRTGDVFEWEVPDGIRRIRVEAVLYHPPQASSLDPSLEQEMRASVSLA